MGAAFAYDISFLRYYQYEKNKTMIFLFILPTVICLLFMYVYPIVRTVIMSFFKVESLTASTSTWSFYGLQNYFKILRNAGFISSMKNMVMIWLVGGIITMCLSMLMAVILTSGIRGAKFFKAAIYMPNIISAVALATMWIQYVFNYDYGLLNQIVKLFGGENVRWLGTDLIFWAMMIAFIFGSVGYYMLIFISGIEGIPQDLYEAATIDGANIFDRFFQITLPLLKGVIRTCVTFWSINATTFFPVDEDVLPHQHGNGHYCARCVPVRYGVWRQGCCRAQCWCRRSGWRCADFDYHCCVRYHQPDLERLGSGVFKDRRAVMGKYHDRSLEERASASARLYHCLRVGRAYGCHPVLDRLRQPFLNKGILTAVLWTFPMA